MSSGVRSLHTIGSGIPELDALLGGGLEQGTSTVVLGATGTGKSSLATAFAHAGASNGYPAAIFLFDERLETFLTRSAGLGYDLRPLAEKGLVHVQQMNAGSLSPGEFSEIVRRTVEGEKVQLVVIDSLTGYFHAMPQEDLLLTHMHELLSFLSEREVLSLLIMAQHGVSGSGIEGPVDVSYMADSLVLLRHFDAAGTVRKAISMVKKRHGPHENTIRELRFTSEGMRVGKPLAAFDGLLAGTPTFHGETNVLIDNAIASAE
jgi:circadian clock protein KaiC